MINSLFPITFCIYNTLNRILLLFSPKTNKLYIKKSKENKRWQPKYLVSQQLLYDFYGAYMTSMAVIII